jgi:hypothetical protein
VTCRVTNRALLVRSRLFRWRDRRTTVGRPGGCAYASGPEAYSGGLVLAPELIAQVARCRTNESVAAQGYNDWVADWFARDAAALRNLYTRLPDSPRWLQVSRHMAQRMTLGSLSPAPRPTPSSVSSPAIKGPEPL